MNAEEREALKAAVEKRRKDETFEKSLGRALRNQGLDYEAYIRLIGEVRERAKARKITLNEAATSLASEEEQGHQQKD